MLFKSDKRWLLFQFAFPFVCPSVPVPVPVRVCVFKFDQAIQHSVLSLKVLLHADLKNACELIKYSS